MIDLNNDLFKNIPEISKSLMNFANLGKDLSEEDIKSKPIDQLGFTSSNFNEVLGLADKLNFLAKYSSILVQLGIDKNMVENMTKLAQTLTRAGEEGKNTLGSGSKKSLKDIGLEKESFNNMDRASSTLKDFEKLTKKTKGDNNIKDIVDGLGSVLNIFKK